MKIDGDDLKFNEVKKTIWGNSIQKFESKWVSVNLAAMYFKLAV